MTHEWEAILPGDPRGQPVPYYRGLVALVSCDPSIAVVTKDGSTVEKSEWEEIAKLIADAPRLKEENERLRRVLEEISHTSTSCPTGAREVEHYRTVAWGLIGTAARAISPTTVLP